MLQFNEHLQMECLVKLGRPVVTLGLGRVFAFLVAKMWTNQVDLDERPEHGRSLPLEVISGNNLDGDLVFTRAGVGEKVDLNGYLTHWLLTWWKVYMDMTIT